MKDNTKIIIAVDGFSSCGKSTIAKALAKYAGYVYIDTGAMYRAVAYYALTNGIIKNNIVDEDQLQTVIANIEIHFESLANGEQHVYLNGKDVEKEIRTLTVASAASLVSAIGFVRTAMVEQQQAMGKKKGIVMDGRDIGTVVFPQAELKLFLTATAEVRAQRRYLELQAKGTYESFDNVLANVIERDLRDTTRKESPLKQADDAILVDNTHLNPEEQMTLIIGYYNKTLNRTF